MSSLATYQLIGILDLFQVMHQCIRLGSDVLDNNVDPTNTINDIHKHNGLVHEYGFHGDKAGEMDRYRNH